jgi:hypothetical protein
MKEKRERKFHSKERFKEKAKYRKKINAGRMEKEKENGREQRTE